MSLLAEAPDFQQKEQVLDSLRNAFVSRCKSYLENRVLFENMGLRQGLGILQELHKPFFETHIGAEYTQNMKQFLLKHLLEDHTVLFKDNLFLIDYIQSILTDVNQEILELERAGHADGYLSVQWKYSDLGYFLLLIGQDEQAMSYFRVGAILSDLKMTLNLKD